jgi:hypothetical protein
MFPSTKNVRVNASSFQIVKDSMLQSDELPLSEVIDDEKWQAAFDRHEVSFGNDPDAVYTPAITLWALISQVFFKEENRACKAAVGRIASWWAMLGKIVCSSNTGAYCRARLKIRFEVVREIAMEMALQAEAAYDQQAIEEVQGKFHPVVAKVQSQPTTGRIMLVDGFTVTAADTPENQAEYPQNPSQKEGLGFPLIRGVSLISMVTGLLFAVELGPYAGKQTGETALLWKMLDQLEQGDTLVADCFYCSYWLIAACNIKGVNIVMKNHDKRDDDPLGARRINKHERFVVWLKPKRPEWMSEEEYAALPDQIEIRLVDVIINQAGFRSKKYTIATTILDRKVYSRDWITSVYRSRWLVELDIRSIKCALGMDIIRAKTPEMVRTELWSCFLAYNLITMKMLQSCAMKGRMPRSLSFTTTLQLLANNWLLASVMLTPELVQLGLETSSSETVGNRLDRVEPRANKRRPKLLALLTRPRHVAKLELITAA